MPAIDAGIEAGAVLSLSQLEEIALKCSPSMLQSSLAVEQAGEPALDGRHRALSADTLAIDDLARAAGTQAVEE